MSPLSTVRLIKGTLLLLLLVATGLRFIMLSEAVVVDGFETLTINVPRNTLDGGHGPFTDPIHH